MTTRRTVLNQAQRQIGGKLIDFHGWEMAIQFSGISAEHQAVRTACGAFDLSHMGRLRVSGPRALAFLGRRVCRQLAGIGPGQVRYGLVLAEDGTVEDDVLVSAEDGDSFHVVVNAGNTAKILAAWRADAAGQEGAVEVRDLSADQAMVAVQGPLAAALLAGLGLDGRGLRYYRFADLPWPGGTVRLSRTGYTGEDGFECLLPAGDAERLWRAVLGAGALPCGLGARDTLRLEAGMPLYGNELDRTVTPVEAGLDFAIAKQGGFIGAPVVLDQLAHGAPRRLVGVVVPDRRVPRSGYAVLAGGRAVGAITSGTLSPSLGKAIGMAYVPAALAAPGTALEIDIRGTRVAAEVVPLPFYRRAKPS
jgi:aminomethyltransferase